MDAERLNQEYQRLVRGLVTQGHMAGRAAGGEDLMANPALPDDVLRETVPGACNEGQAAVIQAVSLMASRKQAHRQQQHRLKQRRILQTL